MNSETKVCQNCKTSFTIEPDDFSFYEKMKVPPPTFCPECRLKRRFAWRNERTLYKRICNLCSKNIIAMYNDDVSFPVYCKECWYGDGWEPTSYGREFDINRSFFEQYKDLSDVVPRLALFNRNSINSDYTNMVAESKNVYMSVSTVNESENVFFSKIIDKSNDIVDCLSIKDGQNLYENIEGEKNYNCQFLLLSRNCIDSSFLVDCVNCSNCILSYNLRNKEYHIRNIKLNKEEYFQELEKINVSSRKSQEQLIQEFELIKKKAIYRYANILRSVDSSGNNLLNAKNCKHCFDVYDAENIKYGFRAFMSLKDSMDVSLALKSELMYEYITGASNDYNVKFSSAAMNFVRNADYTDFCTNCTNVFGGISLRNNENVILNKVYSKEEFENLRRKIIEQMSVVPYIDKLGREYRYGEFFPTEISPWAYNETLAQEVWTLSKEEVEKKGYNWYEPKVKNFNITVLPEDVPDSIGDVSEDFIKEVIGCIHKGDCGHQCNIAFRITEYELSFYKKHNIPVPIMCPNCRYYERIKSIPALDLWHRKCMRDGCQNEFETSYAPDRPEIVYCEKCYQQEVI